MINFYTSSNKKRAFTALELLIVIAIIGILISIALSGINFSRKRTRDNIRVSDIKNITLALQQYHDVCRQYPADIYIDTPYSNNGCPQNINWGTFMNNNIPKDPSGSNYEYVSFQILSQSRCVGYHIGAIFEDSSHKALDTDDDQAVSNGGTCGGNDFDGNPPPGSTEDIMYDIYKM